ncbi:hypothetical protein BHE74_00018160 [Ensete ventricosum]|nr:hypothetical protein BHE74_00018160 [Ensete ventricosum]
MHSLRPRLSSVAAAMDGCGSPAGKRRIMVVADPGRESAAALEWALYHAVLEHDDIILLHVEPVSARRASALSSFLGRPPSGVSPVLSPQAAAVAAAVGAGDGGGDYEFLDAMRARCQAVQPTATVQIERVEMESKDKAAAILTQTQLSRADRLVIGQRRNATSFLG